MPVLLQTLSLCSALPPEILLDTLCCIFTADHACCFEHVSRHVHATPEAYLTFRGHLTTVICLPCIRSLRWPFIQAFAADLAAQAVPLHAAMIGTGYASFHAYVT